MMQNTKHEMQIPDIEYTKPNIQYPGFTGSVAVNPFKFYIHCRYPRVYGGRVFRGLNGP
jgi:hypothetical protein